MPSHLETLKARLKSARKLGPVLDEFLKLTETPGFLERGRRVTAPDLDAVVRQLGGRLTAPLLAVRLDGEGFLHGSFAVEGRMGVVFSFDELQMGLVALSTVKSGWTDLYRFTLKRVAGEGFEP